MPPRKKTNPLLIIGGVIGGIVLVCCIGVAVLAAASKGGNSPTIIGTTTATTSSGNQSNGSSGAQHFKVGDQVKVSSDYVVTVNSVNTSQGDEFLKPKDGNTYVIVDVTLKNVSSKEQSVSSLLQFSLKDGTGQKYTETIVTNATPPDGKIAAGDQLRGQLAYEVPANQHALTFIFEADPFSGGQTIWDLSI